MDTVDFQIKSGSKRLDPEVILLVYHDANGLVRPQRERCMGGLIAAAIDQFPTDDATLEQQILLLVVESIDFPNIDIWSSG